MGLINTGSVLTWIIVGFLVNKYHKKIPLINGIEKNVALLGVLVVGLLMTGMIGGLSGMQMGVGAMSIKAVDFGVNTGSNITFVDVATDINHARATQTDTALIDADAVQGMNLTVTRSTVELGACEITLASPNFNDPIDSGDTTVYNLVQKTNNKELAYINGVQIGDGYTLAWAEGVTSQTIAFTYKASDSAIEQLSSQDSVSMYLNVCGQNYEVEVVSTTA